MTNPEALQLINKAQNITGLTLTSSLLCKKHFSPKLFFLKIADQEVFSLLFDCLNKKLACKFSGDTAESSKKDYKPLTLIAQFVRLYGVILSAENNKDGTLKERIKDTLAKNPGTGLYEKHITAEFQDSADELKIISESKTKYHQLITTAFQAPAGLF